MRTYILCITGACGKVAHALYNSLCQGYVFGTDITLHLRLLDKSSKVEELKILREELEDCCYSNVLSISVFATENEKEAFNNADVVLFLGGVLRAAGMERSEVFEINAEIFAAHGRNLDLNPNKNVKCLVIANPANTNCMVLAANAPSIPRENFTALTRLGFNRFLSMAAKSFQCNPQAISNVILWGNHSKKEYLDVAQMEIKDMDKEVIQKQLLKMDMELISKIMYERGGFLEKGGSSYVSFTKAIMDHLKDWFIGSGKTVSMGVIVPQNSYGLPVGLCYSMPTYCPGMGVYKIVDNLVLSEYQKKRIDEGKDELLKEKLLIEGFLHPNKNA